MTNFNNREQFIEIANRYLQGKATAEEIIFLEKYYEYFDKEKAATTQLSPAEKEKLEKELFAAINEKIAAPVVAIPFHKRSWFRIAAAVVVLVTGAVFFFQNRQVAEKRIAENEQVFPEIVPGGNKAVLTLADESSIVLDNAANGNLASQGNTNLVKSDGQLMYNASGRSSELLYNTITTPRGGQYQLTLSDGTKVWLNAATSLKFPVAFTGNERKVEVSGEAYFEVAKNTAQPFRVNVAGAGVVEVLGTHFNINAYAEENNSKITLLEGLVKFSNTNTTRFIKPGQQAQVDNGQVKMLNSVDIEEVMAWKNGKFLFDRSDVQTTMRQIARWYDVEIIYQGKVDGFFKGTISRYENISKVLNMLQMTEEAHFAIEGRKVIVKP